jgi:hypothetical protein
VGNLINEQLQVLISHKEDSTLDVLNNNMIQELFAARRNITQDSYLHSGLCSMGLAG